MSFFSKKGFGLVFFKNRVRVRVSFCLSDRDKAVVIANETLQLVDSQGRNHG